MALNILTDELEKLRENTSRRALKALLSFGAAVCSERPASQVELSDLGRGPVSPYKCVASYVYVFLHIFWRTYSEASSFANHFAITMRQYLNTNDLIWARK